VSRPHVMDADYKERIMKKAKAVSKPIKKKNADSPSGEVAALEAIAAMPEADRAIASRLHAMIAAEAPELSPRTWYGMPAYAKKNGKIVCFFQSTQRFKTRYATFGFMHEANLDDGDMWPTAFALKKATGAEQAKIAALIKKAVS